MINCSITTIELVRSTTVEGFHVAFPYQSSFSNTQTKLCLVSKEL